MNFSVGSQLDTSVGCEKVLILKKRFCQKKLKKEVSVGEPFTSKNFKLCPHELAGLKIDYL